MQHRFTIYMQCLCLAACSMTVAASALTLSGGKPAAGHGGAIYIAQAGGMVSNCVIRNRAPAGWGAEGGGCYIEKNASTAIVGNTTALDLNGHPEYIGCGGTAASFTRCLSETAANDDCFAASASAVFRDFGAGDFRLHPTSPAVNKGAPLAWATRTATDLAGKPRLSGGLDIGAYECYTDGMILAVR